MTEAKTIRRVSPTKILHTCPVCGEWFYPKRSNFVKTCDRKCGGVYREFFRRARRNGGRVSHTRRMNINPRERVVVDVAARREKANEAYAAKQIELCKDCLCYLPYKRYSNMVCDPCKDARAYASRRKSRETANYRILKAKDKAKRRAILSAALERVDPYKVFERDRYQCQECGKDTPMQKRGTHDHDAPELDHIKPLARGGDHSYANTQCLCRACNGAKGASYDEEADERKIVARM